MTSNRIFYGTINISATKRNQKQYDFDFISAPVTIPSVETKIFIRIHTFLVLHLRTFIKRDIKGIFKKCIKNINLYYFILKLCILFFVIILLC